MGLLSTVKHRSLRAYLTARASAGRYDARMCSYYGCDPHVNRGCQKFICRAFVAGLVPTATRGGHHAPDSYHYKGRAVDVGLRRELIGTKRGNARLQIFQRREYWRRNRGKIHPLELIGPNNVQIILAGRHTPLQEGTALEQAHDNHVHEAY